MFLCHLSHCSTPFYLLFLMFIDYCLTFPSRMSVPQGQKYLFCVLCTIVYFRCIEKLLLQQ